MSLHLQSPPTQGLQSLNHPGSAPGCGEGWDGWGHQGETCSVLVSKPLFIHPGAVADPCLFLVVNGLRILSEGSEPSQDLDGKQAPSWRHLVRAGPSSGGTQSGSVGSSPTLGPPPLVSAADTDNLQSRLQAFSAGLFYSMRVSGVRRLQR